MLLKMHLSITKLLGSLHWRRETLHQKSIRRVPRGVYVRIVPPKCGQKVAKVHSSFISHLCTQSTRDVCLGFPAWVHKTTNLSQYSELFTRWYNITHTRRLQCRCFRNHKTVQFSNCEFFVCENAAHITRRESYVRAVYRAWPGATRGYTKLYKFRHLGIPYIKISTWGFITLVNCTPSVSNLGQLCKRWPWGGLNFTFRPQGVVLSNMRWTEYIHLPYCYKLTCKSIIIKES